MRRLSRLTIVLLAACVMAMVGAPERADAVSPYLAQFNAMFNTTATRLDTCTVCHTAPPALNPYGQTVSANGSRVNIGNALTASQPANSDGDSAINSVEIAALTFPGNPADFPAAPPPPPPPPPPAPGPGPAPAPAPAPAGLIFKDGLATPASAANWNMVSGTWGFLKGALVSTGTTVFNASLTNGVPALDQFNAGKLETRIQLTDKFQKSANGGMVFAFANGGQYRFVRVKGTKLVIGQVGDFGGDVAGRKAQTTVTIPLKVWHKLSVEIHPTGLVVAQVSEVLPDGTLQLVGTVEHTFPQAAPGGVGLMARQAKTKFIRFRALDATTLTP